MRVNVLLVAAIAVLLVAPALASECYSCARISKKAVFMQVNQEFYPEMR